MDERPGIVGGWRRRLAEHLRAPVQSREELVADLRSPHYRDLIGADTLDIMEGAMQVAEMQVRDIMVPRPQMVVVGEDAGFDTILPVVVASGHSRFPAIGDNRDEIIGILLAKELLQYCGGHEGDRFTLREILRPAVYIPESKRLDVLLREFRANRNHMAIVADEYGGVAGLVTIEDVLEQIVGDIADETDQDRDPQIRRRDDGGYNVKALTPIEDFNARFGTHYSDQEVDTIGGLVLSSLGHLPQRGERVVIRKLAFTVLNADSRRIHLLRVDKAPTGEAPQ
jgi:magnesium and cobalt transporter